jgi:peptidoglycan hydrolase-like protein with peptidoglycan-binding domain
MAVANFQKAYGLSASGKYDAATHAALTAALAGQPGDVEATKAKYVEIQKNKQCYVRTQPNTDGEKLGIAHSGDRLPYLGTTYDNGWFSVKYKDKEACVSGKYAQLVE